jgi:hypothetical protein
MNAYGNVYEFAVAAFLGYVAGEDLVMREAIWRKMETVRDELAGADPTPLERILCERVALTWAAANEMDRRCLRVEGTSYKDAEFREFRRDRAHRRFLDACRTLATVRKLARPVVQLNVANQQVNVAGST